MSFNKGDIVDVSSELFADKESHKFKVLNVRDGNVVLVTSDHEFLKTAPSELYFNITGTSTNNPVRRSKEIMGMMIPISAAETYLKKSVVGGRRATKRQRRNRSRRNRSRRN